MNGIAKTLFSDPNNTRVVSAKANLTGKRIIEKILFLLILPHAFLGRVWTTQETANDWG